MNLAAREIPGLGDILGVVNMFRLFVAGPPDATAPEATLETKSEGLTQEDISKAGGGLYLESKNITNRKSLDRDLKEDLLKNPVADAIARNNSPATTIINAVEDVSGLTSGEIEVRIEQTYGQAAIDVIRETIGEQDLKEYMNRNGIKNISGLTSHISKLYSNVDQRRTLIADLGIRKYDSTITSENPLGNGLETMAYVADTAWFLAGGNKKQMADDFGFAFNRDINGFIPFGVNDNFETQNIRSLLWERLNPLGETYGMAYQGLPATGFGRRYLDTLHPNEDQAHHFTGIFWMTAHGTFVLGSNETTYLETFNGWRNQGDINLGRMAVFAYYDKRFWQSPGTWIMRHLGE
jgi:hypothetical protein